MPTRRSIDCERRHALPSHGLGRVGDQHARNQDVTWHPIALEQPDEKVTRPEVLQIASPSMGDVFVAAKYNRYYKGRKVLREFGLLYTTRPVAEPRVCK